MIAVAARRVLCPVPFGSEMPIAAQRAEQPVAGVVVKERGAGAHRGEEIIGVEQIGECGVGARASLVGVGTIVVEHNFIARGAEDCYRDVNPIHGDDVVSALSVDDDRVDVGVDALPHSVEPHLHAVRSHGHELDDVVTRCSAHDQRGALKFNRLDADHQHCDQLAAEDFIVRRHGAAHGQIGSRRTPILALGISILKTHAVEDAPDCSIIITG
jgi:hypothetical protein